MSKKQAVNMVIAIRFDDINDAKYKEIVDVALNGEMWAKGHTVFAQAFDTHEEMKTALEKINQEED